MMDEDSEYQDKKEQMIKTRLELSRNWIWIEVIFCSLYLTLIFAPDLEHQSLALQVFTGLQILLQLIVIGGQLYSYRGSLEVVKYMLVIQAIVLMLSFNHNFSVA